MSVRNNVGWALNEIQVAYVFLVDVAVGRRPYIDEKTGHILVRCNASLVGALVSVAASVPTLLNISWYWDNVTLNGSNVLPFELGALPLTVNTDMNITFTWRAPTRESEGGSNITIAKQRRLMRAPPLNTSVDGPNGTVQAVQVDHHRRGILVGGEPFVGSGWYMDGNDAHVWARKFRFLTPLPFFVSMAPNLDFRRGLHPSTEGCWGAKQASNPEFLYK